MRLLSQRIPRAGIAVLLVGTLVLVACGGKTEPTAIVRAPAQATATGAPTAPAVATTSAVAPAPAVATAAIPTATTISATPTPLSPTALVATGTAISATSSAFTGSAPAGVPPSNTKPSDPQAQATVDKARARFDQVNTLHFALAIEGDVYLDTTRTQKLRSADGDLVRPDKVSLTAKASIGPINAQLKFIQVGDNSYLTNILTGKWEKAPAGFAYDPRVVFDPDKGVAAIMGKVPTSVQPVTLPMIAATPLSGSKTTRGS